MVQFCRWFLHLLDCFFFSFFFVVFFFLVRNFLRDEVLKRPLGLPLALLRCSSKQTGLFYLVNVRADLFIYLFISL